MGFLDPYAIDGATATAAQARQQTYAAMKGETGVSTPEALRVQAVSGSPGVAGIGPGSGVVTVESRRETYQVSNTAMDGNALLDVPAAGSSGATHYVIVSVTDPQYHGQEPATEPRLVPSLSGLNRPYLPLARISLAAGESFDATSSITDLRQVAVPREKRYLFAHNMDIDDGNRRLINHSDDGQSWPNLNWDEWQVDIPHWATRAAIIGTWHSVMVWSGGMWGNIWVRLGWNPDQADYIGHTGTQFSTWDLPDVGSSQTREAWSVAHTVSIPRALRGTRQPLRLRARRRDGLGNTDAPTLNYTSAISIDVQFMEAAV